MTSTESDRSRDNLNAHLVDHSKALALRIWRIVNQNVCKTIQAQVQMQYGKCLLVKKDRRSYIFLSNALWGNASILQYPWLSRMSEELLESHREQRTWTRRRTIFQHMWIRGMKDHIHDSKIQMECFEILLDPEGFSPTNDCTARGHLANAVRRAFTKQMRLDVEFWED